MNLLKKQNVWIKTRRRDMECCKKVVSLEDNFIDLAFEMGPVEGMEPSDIKIIYVTCRLEIKTT